MYKYYGAPAMAFREGGLATRAPTGAHTDYDFVDELTDYDFVDALTASDPQRHAQVAAANAPNGMAPAAAATVMHHAELNGHFGNPLPRKSPRKFIPKVVQPTTCEVCKIQCDSLEVLMVHKTGKKHKRNLYKLQDSIMPKQENSPSGAVGASTAPAAAVAEGVMPAVKPKRKKRSAATPEDLEAKKRRVLEAGAPQGEVKICTACNVVVNSQKAYESHIAGPKHKAKASVQRPNGAVGASTVPAAAVTDGVMSAVQAEKNKSSAATPEDLEVKKRPVLEAGAAQGELKICTMSNVVKKIPKVVQPVTCEVGKIQCTTLDDLRRAHETGTKHKKNLEKLQDSIAPEPAKPPNGAVGASAAPAAPGADGMIPAVQPKKNKSSAATPEDLEAKKRRLIEAGAAEGELKLCTMCNVVAMNQKGYEHHIAGNRHKAKVQPPNGAVGVSTTASATAVADDLIPAVQPKKNTSSAATPEDLEAKKRRLIETGAAEGELRLCMMCNVVAMNQKGYEHHIAGNRHKAKLQKQQQAQLLHVA